MKTKSLLHFVFCLFIMGKVGLAQPATVFYLGIEVDPILVEFNKVEDKSRNWLNGVATSEVFPGYLIDSIQQQTVKLISQFSKVQASMCLYPMSTKLIQGYALNHIDSLPHYTLKNAYAECPKAERYIWIYAHLVGTLHEKTMFSEEHVTLTVEINYKVYDGEKNTVKKAKTTLKHFGDLPFTVDKAGSIEIRKSEVLSPQDIYYLYVLALNEVLLAAY